MFLFFSAAPVVVPTALLSALQRPRKLVLLLLLLLLIQMIRVFGHVLHTNTLPKLWFLRPTEKKTSNKNYHVANHTEILHQNWVLGLLLLTPSWHLFHCPDWNLTSNCDLGVTGEQMEDSMTLNTGQCEEKWRMNHKKNPNYWGYALMHLLQPDLFC